VVEEVSMSDNRRDTSGPDLTKRERKVLELLARGYGNDEIALELSLTCGTVKWHLVNIYDKLKVNNRMQAVNRARELKLLP
jgi:LuxR family transcriptional regulator, maltose regulon positive regulatory protein